MRQTEQASSGNTTKNLTIYKTLEGMDGETGTKLSNNTEYKISIPELGSTPSTGGLSDYATVTDAQDDVNLDFNVQEDVSDDTAFNTAYNISGLAFNFSTAEYLSGLTEEELKSALGYIGDYDIFFDKDYILNGDTLTYSADHSSDSGTNWTELNITNSNIELTAGSGSNIIRLSVSDLEDNEASIYVKYTTSN